MSCLATEKWMRVYQLLKMHGPTAARIIDAMRELLAQE